MIALVNEARDLARGDDPEALVRYRRAVGGFDTTPVRPASIVDAEVVIDELLDRPSERLVVYGTLAPGESNHHLVRDLDGRWVDGTVRGIRGEFCGLPTFVADRNAEPVEILIFCSPDLPAAYRSFLDDFEGVRWPRRLIEVDSTAFGVSAASVYEFDG